MSAAQRACQANDLDAFARFACEVHVVDAPRSDCAMEDLSSARGESPHACLGGERNPVHSITVSLLDVLLEVMALCEVLRPLPLNSQQAPCRASRRAESEDFAEILVRRAVRPGHLEITARLHLVCWGRCSGLLSPTAS